MLVMIKKDNLNNSFIKFEKVNKSKQQVNVLYKLLKKRKKNITHTKLPKFKEHEHFVKNHPYRIWYIVKKLEKEIGYVYLLKNNILGIFIYPPNKKIIIFVIDWIVKKYKPLKKIKSVRRGNFQINVAPDDTTLKKSVIKIKAKHIQSTFSIEKKNI